MSEFIDEPDTIRNEAMDDGMLVTDNRTIELCKLLEERGVKWKTKSYPSSLLLSKQLTDTHWQARNAEWKFTERPDGRTYLTLIGIWPDCTPEQAVAATLGSEREKELESLLRDWRACDPRCTNRSCGDCEHDEDDGCGLYRRMCELGVVD